jgi:hypothetical protein
MCLIFLGGFWVKKVKLIASFLSLILFLTFQDPTYAWSNGGYSSDPSNPDYGTHDWIAEHALDWLLPEAKQWIMDNLNWYLYGTELPDNRQAPDGIGDTGLHHIYYRSDGSLVDDAAAKRANETFEKSLSYLLSGEMTLAAKYAGAMTHYIADMAVFSHVMGAGTDWGAEKHHSDYESYVNSKTSSYNAEFNMYLSFDGELRLTAAYQAAVGLAYDTTFDSSGRGLTCIWMDQKYNWSDTAFRNRAGESLNLAVNYVADVLYTLYITYMAQQQTATAAVTFLANGLGYDAYETVLTVDETSYSYSQLPISFLWDTGSSHTFEWKTSLNSTTSGKRYTWSSTSGLSSSRSGTITVPHSGGSIAATYRTQYNLNLTINPSSGGTISANPPSSDWFYDSGVSVTLTASAAPGFDFDAWTGDVADINNPANITMETPKSVTANFFTFNMSVAPNSRSCRQGESITASVTVIYQSGVKPKIISLSASSQPPGVTIRFSLTSVTISPSSTRASSTITIQTNAATQASTYTITITGASGSIVKKIDFSITVLETEKAWYEQPWVIAAIVAAIIILVAITLSQRHKA